MAFGVVFCAYQESPSKKLQKKLPGNIFFLQSWLWHLPHTNFSFSPPPSLGLKPAKGPKSNMGLPPIFLASKWGTWKNRLRLLTGRTVPKTTWVFPKIMGNPPKSSILIRFSHYFWKHPLKDVDLKSSLPMLPNELTWGFLSFLPIVRGNFPSCKGWYISPHETTLTNHSKLDRWSAVA